ncbi:hypothetical protein [Breznakiella homolactica]|uniref:Uncharacterized protein n=1 Tax=Breznakiella homolactica TaxID=2798577 RepID=A0A7T7XQ94_9SPIR|nr:hypothetical protein [Breznakiella homolactica]QQO10464.1 hypothetical protein JFL75_05995 [Breznakiella homolactica]
MNAKKMVKLSNGIGFVAVISLLYWVIIFITVQVFGLKIFKEHITEVFIYSIIGILVLMSGALMINVMINLTRIAEKINNDNELGKTTKNRKGILVFLVSIPLIIMGLFLGNFLSTKKIERELKMSGDEIISTYRSEIDTITDYSLSKEWINSVVNIINFMLRIDTNITDAAIILEDEINGNNFYLTFNRWDEISKNENTEINKLRYIRNYDFKERQYLERVFNDGYNEKYFIQNNDSYDLFIPYRNGEKTIIVFFSNRQRYGSLSK